MRHFSGFVALFLGSLSFAACAMAQPVIHLKFDNPASLGADSSGNNNNGQANGATHRANGVAGGAAAFNGESVINLGEGIASALTGDFTISMWLETTVAEEEELEVFGASDSLTGPKLAVMGNKAGFGVNGEHPSTLHSQSAVTTGNFVHVVVSRNAATGQESIYINGALEATRVGNGNSINVHNLLALGGNPGQGRGFAGAIDDFQLYNRAANASAVAFLHANPGSAVIGALQIPEPSTYALIGLGLVVVGFSLRRSRRRAGL